MIRTNGLEPRVERIELCCNAEKERAVYFIDAHTRSHVKHFVLRQVGAFGHVKLFGVHFYLGVFHYASHE